MSSSKVHSNKTMHGSKAWGDGSTCGRDHTERNRLWKMAPKFAECLHGGVLGTLAHPCLALGMYTHMHMHISTSRWTCTCTMYMHTRHSH